MRLQRGVWSGRPATADILKVIASSPDDVQPVFQAIAERSNRICRRPVDDRGSGMVGDALHLMAFTPTSPEADAALANVFPATVSRRWQMGESDPPRRDLSDSPTPRIRNTTRMGGMLARKRGWRSLLGVPLLREGKPIGLITRHAGRVGVVSTTPMSSCCRPSPTRP